MVGWDYQRIGDPNYSVENHVAQVNNAIAPKPDIILTELESPGLLPAFERGIEQGITMVIVNQGREEESKKLGLNIIGQDEFELPAIVNGYQAAHLRREADRQEGEASSSFGNGNPGSIAIDKRQAGSEQGVKNYNRRPWHQLYLRGISRRRDSAS